MRNGFSILIFVTLLVVLVMVFAHETRTSSPIAAAPPTWSTAIDESFELRPLSPKAWILTASTTPRVVRIDLQADRGVDVAIMPPGALRSLTRESIASSSCSKTDVLRSQLNCELPAGTELAVAVMDSRGPIVTAFNVATRSRDTIAPNRTRVAIAVRAK